MQVHSETADRTQSQCFQFGTAYIAGTGAEWPFNFLPEIEFWALIHIKFQSNSAK